MLSHEHVPKLEKNRENRQLLGKCPLHGVVALVLIALSVVACAPENPETLCAMRTRLASSCRDQPSAWSTTCVATRNTAGCAPWLEPAERTDGNCAVSLEVQAVDLESCLTVHGEPALEGAQGAPCLDPSHCASGLCAFSRYCTAPCVEDVDCVALGPGAICVGDSPTTATCVPESEANWICPPNSTRADALPTRCTCNDEYVSDGNGGCRRETNLALGTTCSESSQCESGICFGDLATTSLWCSMACVAHIECEPLRAGGASRVCCIDDPVEGGLCGRDDFCP